MSESKTIAKGNGTGKKSGANGAGSPTPWDSMMETRAKAFEAMLDSGRDFVTGLTRVNEELMSFAESQMESGAARCREIAEAGHPTAALRLNAEIARAATAKSIEAAGQILSLMTRAGGAGLLVLHDGTQTLIQDGARSVTGALAAARA
jgi:hypothetical protein